MELVDIFDRRRTPQGRVKERHDLADGEYRISVHIWIIDGDKILVQQRSLSSHRFAGLWSQTAGGVDAGESSLDACKRECMEELGLSITDQDISFVGSYARTNDIVDIFAVEHEIDLAKLVKQDSEVNDIRMLTLDEFDRMIDSGLVVPSIDPSYTYFKNYLKMYR